MTVAQALGDLGVGPARSRQESPVRMAEHMGVEVNARSLTDCVNDLSSIAVGHRSTDPPLVQIHEQVVGLDPSWHQFFDQVVPIEIEHKRSNLHGIRVRLLRDRSVDVVEPSNNRDFVPTGIQVLMAKSQCLTDTKSCVMHKSQQQAISETVASNQKIFKGPSQDLWCSFRDLGHRETALTPSAPLHMFEERARSRSSPVRLFFVDAEIAWPPPFESKELEI